MKNLKFKIIIPTTLIFMLTLLCTSLQTGAHEVFSEKTVLIPCGTPVGIAVYSKGVLVSGTEPVKNVNGIETNAAKNAGLKKGDIIISANGTEVNSNEALAEIITASGGDVNITAMRSGYVFNTAITPVETASGKKAGIWVRDSTAGIGTITWYNPKNKTFAALGHGISDSDTCQIFSIRNGDIFRCSITGAVKGAKGAPGELNGIFENTISGAVLKNTLYGVFGTLNETDFLNGREAIPAAEDSQICEGPATMLCDVDGGGTKEYSIEIVKTDFNNTEGKNFILKITDEALIEKTGGIVQGMSGAPIIQNNMIAGAVTHVFINNPLKGYGISVSKMNSVSE